MWWSIAVLTNVEYGYVYPIKLLGMTCVSFITLIVIRIVALPAGIIAENFRNELRKLINFYQSLTNSLEY